MPPMNENKRYLIYPVFGACSIWNNTKKTAMENCLNCVKQYTQFALFCRC